MAKPTPHTTTQVRPGPVRAQPTRAQGRVHQLRLRPRPRNHLQRPRLTTRPATARIRSLEKSLGHSVCRSTTEAAACLARQVRLAAGLACREIRIGTTLLQATLGLGRTRSGTPPRFPKRVGSPYRSLPGPHQPQPRNRCRTGREPGDLLPVLPFDVCRLLQDSRTDPDPLRWNQPGDRQPIAHTAPTPRGPLLSRSRPIPPHAQAADPPDRYHQRAVHARGPYRVLLSR